MNPTHVILPAFALLGIAFAAPARNLSAHDASPVKVFLVDDQTGEELFRDHGIEPITVPDLAILVGGVVASQREVVLHYELIDDDASDNEVRMLRLHPYDGEAPPSRPSMALPLRQLTEETARFRERQAIWIAGVRRYRSELERAVETYVREMTEAQLALAERFNQMLLERNGRDFNRSDVTGTVLSAAGHLGTEGQRIMVLNTDAWDTPPGRAGRRAPYTPEELDPGIVLIWVNTSGLPQKQPAFAGLPNPAHHVATMAEAMALVCELVGIEPGIGETGDQGEDESDQS